MVTKSRSRFAASTSPPKLPDGGEVEVVVIWGAARERGPHL
jgi:hypothetical protein